MLDGLRIGSSPEHRVLFRLILTCCHPNTTTPSSERFRRSLEAWGPASQELLTKLKVGIVGLGSVGALAAEAMGRIGVHRLVLIDMDRIERHNLDRLLHAGPWDVGRYKVDLAAENLERAASHPFHELLVLPLSLRDSKAYRALADCDVILACADKPIARGPYESPCCLPPDPGN